MRSGDAEPNGRISRPASNSSAALERLRLHVADHPLDGDLQLAPERELARTFGLGRRAIRRALEVLEAEGLIWRQQGKGTFIGNRPAGEGALLANIPALTDPAAVMEAREAIEPTLAALAALRASPADCDALDQSAQRLTTTSDADAHELWDSALHRRIAVAAGNSVLLHIFDLIDRIRKESEWRRVRDAARRPERQQLYLDQHAAIIRAIRDQDAAGAAEAMRGHIATVHANYRAQITGQTALSDWLARPAQNLHAAIRDEVNA